MELGSIASLFFLTILILFYGLFTTYDADASTLSRYPQYQDVHVMIFIGFGFLMCFLHRAGFTATSHAFLVAVFAVLWAILNRGFWARAFGNLPWNKIEISIENLINADFAAGAVLISFGAMIGRISADQLMLMCAIEVICYSINEAILVYKYEVADIGGTMIIHCFGAYFGLACSWMLNTKQDAKTKNCYNNKSNPTTDTMAMVGTLFLFCFWPSFNSALAGLTFPQVQQRATVNTLLSISTSTMVAFMMCRFFYGGKFRMVEVQNATLAGGVGIGSCADMFTTPAGAMTIGFVCGVVSVVGYRFLLPWLESKIELKDTCGIHNLHGMPSVIGALAAVIVARKSEIDQYGPTLSDTFSARNITDGVEGRSSRLQSNYQLAGLATTLGIAIVTGALTGLLLKLLPTLDYFFVDNIEYEGLEGHGTGGANIKHTLSSLLRFNAQPAPPEAATRKLYFTKWLRWIKSSKPPSSAEFDKLDHKAFTSIELR